MALVFGVATAAQATTVTVEFAGLTTSNPGLPGSGGYSGTVTYETEGATWVSGGLFNSVITEVDIDINGVNIESAGAPTLNTFNQVQLGDERDAFFGTYEGSFLPTGIPLISIKSVYLELRMQEDVEIFSTVSELFDELADGETLGLGSVGFFSLVVEYNDAPFSDSSILRLGSVGSLEITVSGPAAVPLPAGLPLLLTALGGIALLRRRSRG